jgi:Grx4 family monothiol glutaredoxin
LSELAKT